MKQILIFSKKRIQVPEKAWTILAIYKTFWPPETVVRLGKKHLIKLIDIDPWPPLEQGTIDF